MNPNPCRGQPARERLMKAAAELFYSQGIAATGIDSITQRAGVARKSIYNNFASKNDLVFAYIQEQHQEYLDMYELLTIKAESSRSHEMAVVDEYIYHS